MLSIANSPRVFGPSWLTGTSNSDASYDNVFTRGSEYQLDRKLRAIDTSTRTLFRRFVQGNLIDCLKVDAASIDCFAISEKASIMVLCVGQALYVVRLSDYYMIQQLGYVQRSIVKNIETVQPFVSLAIDPTGQYVATCGGDSRVLVWNIKKGLCEKVLEKHKQQVFAVAFDGKDRLISAGEDGRVLLWNWRSSSVIDQKWKHPAAIRTLCVSNIRPSPGSGLRDPEHLLFSGANDGSCTAWSLDDGTAFDVFVSPSVSGPFGCALNDIARSSDGRLLGLASSDHNCYVYSLATYFNRLQSNTDTERIRPDPKYIDITDLDEWDKLRESSKYILTEIRVGESQLDSDGHASLKFTLGHGAPVLSVSFGVLSDTIVTGCMDSTLRVWSAVTGVLLFQVNTPLPVRQLSLPKSQMATDLSPWEQSRLAERMRIKLQSNPETATALSVELVYCTCGNRVLVFEFIIYAREDVNKSALLESPLTSAESGVLAGASSSKDASASLRAVEMEVKRSLTRRASENNLNSSEAPKTFTFKHEFHEQCFSLSQLSALAEHGRMKPSFIDSILNGCPRVSKSAFYSNVNRYQLNVADILQLLLKTNYSVEDLLGLIADNELCGIALSMLFDSDKTSSSQIAAVCGIRPVDDPNSRFVYLDPTKDLLPVEALKLASSSVGAPKGWDREGGLEPIEDELFESEYGNASQSEDENTYGLNSVQDREDEHDIAKLRGKSKAASDIYMELTNNLEAAHRKKLPKNRRQLKLFGNDINSNVGFWKTQQSAELSGFAGQRSLPLGRMGYASTNFKPSSVNAANNSDYENESTSFFTVTNAASLSGLKKYSGAVPKYSSDWNTAKAPHLDARGAVLRGLAVGQMAQGRASHVHKWDKSKFHALREKNTSTSAYLRDYFDQERNNKRLAELQLASRNPSYGTAQRGDHFGVTGNTLRTNYLGSSSRAQEVSLPTQRTPSNINYFDSQRLAQLQHELHLFTSVKLPKDGQKLAIPSRKRKLNVRGLDVQFTPEVWSTVNGRGLARRAAELRAMRSAQAPTMPSAGDGPRPSGLTFTKIGNRGASRAFEDIDRMRDQLVQSRLLNEVMQINPRRKLTEQAYSNTAMGGLILHPSRGLAAKSSNVSVEPIMLRASAHGLSQKYIVGSRLKVAERKLATADHNLDLLVGHKP